MVYELNDILQSGYQNSLFGYDIVGWFMNGVIRLEKKTKFFSQNTRKETIMTVATENISKILTIVGFVKKILILIRIEIIVIRLDYVEDQQMNILT